MADKVDVKALHLTRDFLVSEFRCRCGRKDCDAPLMRRRFMTKLQAMRDEWGKALVPTSGTRCADHNRAVGGAANSQHVYGNAADFNFSRPSDAVAFATLAAKHGMGGIGVGRYLVHVDDRDGETARWTYGDGR